MGAQSAVSSTLVFWLLALGWGVLAVVCGAGEAMCTVCASRSQAELSGGCNMQPQSNSTRGVQSGLQCSQPQARAAVQHRSTRVFQPRAAGGRVAYLCWLITNTIRS